MNNPIFALLSSAHSLVLLLGFIREGEKKVIYSAEAFGIQNGQQSMTEKKGKEKKKREARNAGPDHQKPPMTCCCSWSNPYQDISLSLILQPLTPFCHYRLLNAIRGLALLW
jgi:hypothetical protein